MLTESNIRNIQSAFDLLGVRDFRSLSSAYGQEDQKLMKARTWDDSNPDLITNKIKLLLEGIDPFNLHEDDRMWWGEILWFWYHHAISFAIWKKKDRELARRYADQALSFQAHDHPNKITRLLQLLAYDKLEEAKVWTSRIIESSEKETAEATIKEYENGEFF